MGYVCEQLTRVYAQQLGRWDSNSNLLITSPALLQQATLSIGYFNGTIKEI